jgi:hypothetical protein
VTRADRLTLVRQLREDGLSQRAIAKRLKVSKDTVRRDLERLAAEAEPEDAPPAEPVVPTAPQVSDGDGAESAPSEAPGAEPGTPRLTQAGEDVTEESAPVAQLPRRVAHSRLEMDLDRWPAMRRDLALVALCGRPVEEMVSQAVVAVAFCYRQALARGDLEPGEPFLVTGMTLRPLSRSRPTAAPRAGA